MIYFSLGLTKVHLPLMSLVDYRGYRLVAMSLLPVNNSTLVYGTDDGGKTIKRTNLEFAGIMEEAGRRLKLRPHLCGSDKKKAKILASAADIEGHVGLDDKFYLLDFSRTMPPVQPDGRYLNGHLYQLFRKEFVQKYSKPLCSDAFSGFIMWDKKKDEYNVDVCDATAYLFTNVIPNCALDLIHRLSDGQTGISLMTQMHRHGVNLRYIGLVLKEVVNLPNEMSLDHFDPVNKQDISLLKDSAECLLYMEAVARSIKNQLNANLRQKMKQLKLPLEVGRVISAIRSSSFFLHSLRILFIGSLPQNCREIFKYNLWARKRHDHVVA